MGSNSNDRALPVTDLVELRVHGVSGTAETALLEHGDTVQVAGDRLSGFHRRRGWNAYGPADAVGEVGAVRRHLEAYSWGRLTSGSASRAGWLLLLPFTLVNVAAWAHPAADTPVTPDDSTPSPSAPWRGRRRRALRGSLRLLALSLTVSLVLAAAGIAMDLVGWQCARDVTRCYAGHGNWFRTLVRELGSWPVGVRLAVTALVPAAVVVLLWLLAGRSHRTYEEAPAGDVPRGRGPIDGQRTPFALRQFWRSKPAVSQLRFLHVAASLATVAALVGRAQRPTALSGAVTVAAVATVATCAVLVTGSRAVDAIDDLDRPEGGTPARAVVPRTLLVASALVLLASCAGAAIGWREARAGTVLPGYVPAVRSLTYVNAAALVLVLGLTLAVKPKTRPDPKPFLCGLLTPALAALAAVTGSIFSAGALYKAADFVGAAPRATPPGAGEPYRVVLHEMYLASGVTSGIAIPAVVLVLVVTAFRAWRTAADPPGLVEACHDYRHPHGDPATEARVKGVARARYVASLTDRGPAILALVAVAGVVTGLGTMSMTAGTADPLGERYLWVAWIGSTSVALLLVGLVVVGYVAYRGDRARRSVGVLWDVGTFWPRAAHPLAPPCYCERTVPQLATRISGLTAPGGAVLVSAHSQGSVIAAAALCQLPDAVLPRVAFLTYGSPLLRLYARAFPAYFTTAMLAEIRGRLTTDTSVRWRNCWRKTDYLGRFVFDDTGRNAVDVHVPDPPAHATPCPAETHPPLHPPVGDICPPRPLRHSNYYVAREYDAAVVELDGMLGVRPPPAVDRALVMPK